MPLCNNIENIKGIIHSTESFGAADGPGVRFVIFMQGCLMRCKYCHNPDTWNMSSGEEITADELLTKAARYKNYWRNNGGITVSGGEPLLQIDFLTVLFKKAKKLGINTALDTSGNPFTKSEPFFKKFSELMNYTDLILLDLKQINSRRHKSLTGYDNSNILEMTKYLSDIKKPVWIRHVLVPDYTDSDEDLTALGSFIATLSNVQRIEILPYHTLGKFKWENLGLKYPLGEIRPPTEEQLQNAKIKLSAFTKNSVPIF